MDFRKSQISPTRLVVMVVDPYAVHAYWEAAPAALAKALEKAHPVLRFHERPGTAWFDIDIRLEAGNWYVPLWTAGKSYDVELGFNSRTGEFVSLARARGVQTPRAWPEPGVEEHFMHVSGEERFVEIVPPPEYRKPAREELRAEAPTVLSPMAPKARPNPHPFAKEWAPTAPSPTAAKAPRDYPDLVETVEEKFIAGISSIPR